VNAANVDNSYKWAGGGFLSNVSDLVSFGNAMLFSYQAGNAMFNTISLQDAQI
jgi:serine beta-lactamase-like protein LACTB